MRVRFLTRAFSVTNASIEKFSYQVGRFFTDDNFLDIHPSQTAHHVFQKSAHALTKAKRAAQRSSFRFLLQKNSGSSFDYKPTSKVFMSMAQEGIYLLGKASPYLTRTMTSPVAIGSTLVLVGAIGLTYVLTNDAALMSAFNDQASQIMALLQNDNAEAAPTENTDALPASDAIAVDAEALKPRADFKPTYYV